MSIWGKPVVLKAVGEVSGGFVNIPDGDGSDFRKLSVIIPLTQSGSGTPSLDNIRPVSGWTGGRVTRAGKNLFDMASADWKDGYLISSSGGETSSSVYRYCQTYFLVKPSTQYSVSVVKATSDRTGCSVPIYDSDKNFIERQTIFSVTTDTGTLSGDITTPNNAAYIRISLPILTTNIQVEEGATPTSYESYVGTNYDYDWSSTIGSVAAGTLDVLTGLFTATALQFSFDGTETWQSQSSGSNRFYRFIDYGITTTSSLARGCSHYSNAAVTSSSTNVGYYAYTTSGGANAWLNFRPNLTDCPDVTAWRSFLSTQANNGTPVTCYYTPSTAARPTYQFSPQQVATFIRQNNLWADFGDVNAEYNKQGILYLS